MNIKVLLLLLVSFASVAQHRSIRPHSELWDEYMQRYVANGDFSGNILIVKDETVLFKKSYGKASFELNVPIQNDTRFRIASVSKTFTAAAIVMLNNKGQLSYSDMLSKFVPGFPSGDSISIAHLLLHQSGISDIDYDRYALDRLSSDELLATLKSKPLYFKPGTNFRYSNSGYFILAHIIEKVSGQSYENFLADNIFRPLRMVNSGVDRAQLIIPSKATGYGIGTGATGIAQAAWMDIDMAKGSGSVYSTAEDLMKWLRAINSSKLFDMGELPYPFGWGVRQHFTNRKCILQSGFLSGYSSFISYYPAEGLYVVALSNISSNFNEQAGQDLAAIYFKEKYTMPDERISQIQFNADQYTGKFQWPGYKEFFIEKKDGGINWRFIDERTGSPLAPISKDAFLLRLMNTKILFHMDSDNRANELAFTSGTDTTICKRIN
ncbi:MAG: serine hydrolase domain-containing protein [Chryseolinea sp.]